MKIRAGPGCMTDSSLELIRAKGEKKWQKCM